MKRKNKSLVLKGGKWAIKDMESRVVEKEKRITKEKIQANYLASLSFLVYRVGETVVTPPSSTPTHMMWLMCTSVFIINWKLQV